MKLFTAADREKLLKQGAAQSPENKPVVKLFTPWGKATWLISEIDPQDNDQLFGLCDLGFGCPELGWLSLSEIESVTGPFRLKIERDLHFKADKTLVEYANEARELGHIKA